MKAGSLKVFRVRFDRVQMPDIKARNLKTNFTTVVIACNETTAELEGLRVLRSLRLGGRPRLESVCEVVK